MFGFCFLCVLISLIGSCFGAVFDPYCRRYDLQKSTMANLLLKQGENTVFTKSLISITQSTTTISEPKKSILIEDLKDLDLTLGSNDTVIDFIEYVKELWRIQYLYHPELIDFFQTLRFKNISTWGPLENVYALTDQYYISGSQNSGVDGIWTSIKTQTASGYCQIYDSLITAASDYENGNAEALVYLQASYSPEMCTATENTMFLWYKMCEVDIPPGIKTFLHDQFIGDYFYFNEFCRAAAAYRRLDIYDKYFGTPDPLLVRTMNNSIFSSQGANFTLTQKGFIKQVYQYFGQQFPLLSSIPQKQNLVEMKFSEALDLSDSYFKTFNYVQMEKYDGNFYDMIRHICQRNFLASKFNVSTINKNNTIPNCSQNSTTQSPPVTTANPPTQKPVIPFSCSAPQKFAAIYSRHDVLLYNQGYGRGDFAGVCNSTRKGAMIYMDGRTPSYVTPDGVTAAGSILHNAAYGPCPYLCMCSTTGSCYTVSPTTASKNPEIVMYPHCDVNDECYFAAFISTPGAMTPYNNVGQAYTDALQYDANGARLPISDPSYVRVVSVSCSGCPITIE